MTVCSKPLIDFRVSVQALPTMKEPLDIISHSGFDHCASSRPRGETKDTRREKTYHTTRKEPQVDGHGEKPRRQTVRVTGPSARTLYTNCQPLRMSLHTLLGLVLICQVSSREWVATHGVEFLHPRADTATHRQQNQLSYLPLRGARVSEA